MADFMEFHFKPELLSRFELPDVGYPVPQESLDAILSGGGELPFPMLLHWLQQYSRQAHTGWKELEVAMDRLATLLAPPDERDVIAVGGDTWWLEIGPLDLASRLVRIHREGEIVAAIGSRADGRLRIAAFRPLDAKSAGYLIGLALKSFPPHGVAMRPNNWEYALDCSAGTGNFYAAMQGAAYLGGPDTQATGKNAPAGTYLLQNLIARRPAIVATELGVHYELHNDDIAEERSSI